METSREEIEELIQDHTLRPRWGNLFAALAMGAFMLWFEAPVWSFIFLPILRSIADVESGQRAIIEILRIMNRPFLP